MLQQNTSKMYRRSVKKTNEQSEPWKQKHLLMSDLLKNFYPSSVPFSVPLILHHPHGGAWSLFRGTRGTMWGLPHHRHTHSHTHIQNTDNLEIQSRIQRTSSDRGSKPEYPEDFGSILRAIIVLEGDAPSKSPVACLLKLTCICLPPSCTPH